MTMTGGQKLPDRQADQSTTKIWDDLESEALKHLQVINNGDKYWIS
jgi:hypothetical protein